MYQICAKKWAHFFDWGLCPSTEECIEMPMVLTVKTCQIISMFCCLHACNKICSASKKDLHNHFEFTKYNLDFGEAEAIRSYSSI